MVYVWMLDSLERQVHTQNMIRGMAFAAGAEGDLLDWQEIRERFDQDLCAEPVLPTAEDQDRTVLLTALGLR